MSREIAMHPADQVVAFTKLVQAGQSVSSVAARFALSERLVEQRLRLGNAAPELPDAYRAREASSPASLSPGACGRPASASRWMDAAGAWTTFGRSLGPMAFAASVIERLWGSLKYEAVYLHEIVDGPTARRLIRD